MFSVVREVIVAAAVAFNVNATGMVHLACNESTFNRYATNGEYTGLYQLDRNQQARFYRMGYRDIYDPVQQSLFVAEVISYGEAWRWPPWGRSCRYAWW